MKKYGLTKHRFLELKYFCLQYDEWKKELEQLRDTIKSADTTGQPVSNYPEHPTEILAIKRAELSYKCDLIEETAREAGGDIWKYVLLGVTKEENTYTRLTKMCGMPCCRNVYYEKRRKFYYVLSNKIKVLSDHFC